MVLSLKPFKILVVLLVLGLLAACQVQDAPQPISGEPTEQGSTLLPEPLIPSATDDGSVGIMENAESTSSTESTDEGEPTAAAEATESEAQFPTGTVSEPLRIMELKSVINADVASVGEGLVYFALGKKNNILIMRSVDGGATFSEAVAANGDTPVFMHNIERPSLTVDENGFVGLVWLGDHKEAEVYYTESHDFGQTFSPPVLVVKGQGEGTWLPRVAALPDADSLVAWIQAGKLVISSVSGDVNSPAASVIDPEVCECCPPAPHFVEGQPYIVYRDRGADGEGRVMRNISILSSTNGGGDFGSPVSVSDAPWYIDFCPTSGPVMGANGDAIYVAWMDGRFNAPNSLEKSDIWFAASTDGGRSFSANISLNNVPGAFNNKPSLAVGPDGRIHIAWEADEGTKGVLYYTFSDDGGQSFSTPEIVAQKIKGTGTGLPQNVRLSVDGLGRVYLVWIDRNGAHIHIW